MPITDEKVLQQQAVAARIKELVRVLNTEAAEAAKLGLNVKYDRDYQFTIGMPVQVALLEVAISRRL